MDRSYELSIAQRLDPPNTAAARLEKVRFKGSATQTAYVTALAVSCLLRRIGASNSSVRA
jgi:hypothetical protein